MELIYIIAGALLLDLVIGDPHISWHPVAILGRLALKLENPVRRRVGEGFFGGMICTLLVLFIAGFVAWLFVFLFGLIAHWAGLVASAICVYFTIALRSLISHANDVEKPLKNHDLSNARRKVGMIVSRDIETLDERGVIRSCLESMGENLIDGITSAFFWVIIGWIFWGVYGAVICSVVFRAANTLDATFGYKNLRYRKFGTFPARLDDVLNYIPARLTALAMSLAALILGMYAMNTLQCAWHSRKKHPSPNSTWGMASLAGALGVVLGGPTCYNGVWKKYPEWGRDLELLSIRHIKGAKKLIIVTTIIWVLVMAAVAVFIRR